MAETILVMSKLTKVFEVGVRRRPVRAVDELDLEVQAGEIVGFLGPNGAGKSTTIKMLMGLIFPTSGSARIFDLPIPTPSARARIGFLPENPYFHDFLTPRELLHFAGKLCGMTNAEIAARTAPLVELVGLSKAIDLPLRRFSKGMVQRAGIAQALVNDPALVVLDEPMSGLDPVGRKEVRDVIFRMKEEGKTVFFSSHILPDVEAIADRVALLLGGKLREYGRLDQLLQAKSRAVDVVAEQVPEALGAELKAKAIRAVPSGEGVALTFGDEAVADDAVRRLAAAGARIVTIARHRESLEELFMRRAEETGASRPMSQQQD